MTVAARGLPLLRGSLRRSGFASEALYRYTGIDRRPSTRWRAEGRQPTRPTDGRGDPRAPSHLRHRARLAGSPACSRHGARAGRGRRSSPARRHSLGGAPPASRGAAVPRRSTGHPLHRQRCCRSVRSHHPRRAVRYLPVRADRPAPGSAPARRGARPRTTHNVLFGWVVEAIRAGEALPNAGDSPTPSSLGADQVVADWESAVEAIEQERARRPVPRPGPPDSALQKGLDKQLRPQQDAEAELPGRAASAAQPRAGPAGPNGRHRRPRPAPAFVAELLVPRSPTARRLGRGGPDRHHGGTSRVRRPGPTSRDHAGLPGPAPRVRRTRREPLLIPVTGTLNTRRHPALPTKSSPRPSPGLRDGVPLQDSLGQDWPRWSPRS